MYHHLLTLMLFRTCMTYFLLWNVKEHNLKNDIFLFYKYIYYFHINNLQIEYSLQVDILF